MSDRVAGGAAILAMIATIVVGGHVGVVTLRTGEITVAGEGPYRQH